MRIKRFEALTMAEALEKVKKELGPDAIILSTKEIEKHSDDYGILGRKVYEVVAAIDDGNEENQKNSMQELFVPYGEMRRIREMLEKLAKEMDMGILRMEIEEIKREIKELKRGKSVFKGVRDDVYQFLMDQGVKEVYARKITERVSGESIHAALEDLFSIINKFFIKPKPLKRVVFLVGPTGIGKTTTIAKLAARDTLGKGKKVALITIDTYRIGAAEQLTSYARILNVPIKVVSRIDDFCNAIQLFSGKDVIYVDTTGRSHRDERSTLFVRDFIDAVSIRDVLLLISANMDGDNSEEVVRCYSSLGISGVVYTKMDETRKYGLVINNLVKFRYPIYFFTTGQRVPEDIEPGDSSILIRYLMDSFRKEYGYAIQWGSSRIP